MAETKVRTPAGVITVRHPEGASRDDILEFAQMQFNRPSRQERIANVVASDPAEFDPSSPEFQERFGPVGGPVESFLAGAVSTVPDAVRGVRQGATELLNRLTFAPDLGIRPGENPVFASEVERLREESNRIRELQAPLMQDPAGLAGMVSGNVGLALAPGGIARGTTQLAAGTRLSPAVARASAPLRAFSTPQTTRAAVGSGAVQGALAPVGVEESRALNTAVGGLAGSAGRALAQPFRNVLSRGGRQAVEILEKAGVPLDQAQKTGSVLLQRARSVLGDSALTGGRQAAFVERQARAFTRAVLRTAGINADEATPDVMNAARQRIGRVFNDVAENNPPQYDQILEARLIGVLDQAPRELDTVQAGIVQRNVDDILNAVDSNGIINGQKFNNIRTTLGRLSRRAGISPFAREIDDALVDTLDRQTPAASAALQKARQEWRNLRIIQGSVDKAADRFVSPLRLSNAVQTKANQNLSIFGLGGRRNRELAQLAQAGREVLPETIGNSGTAARQQLLGLATLGGGVLAGQEDPAAGAAVLGLPFLLQAGLLSQGALGNVVRGGVPALLPRFARGAADPITRQLPIQLGRQFQPSQLNSGVIGVPPDLSQ